MKKKNVKNINIFDHLECFLTDCLILGGIFVQPYCRDFIIENYIYMFLSLGILQVLCMYGIFLKPLGFDEEDKIPSWLEFFVILKGLMVILAIGGFTWFGIIAMYIDTPLAWKGFTFNFFISLFGSLIALSLVMDKDESSKHKFHHRFASLFFPLLYILVSELMIIHASESTDFGKGPVLLSIFLSYFPIRYLMIIRPPWYFGEVLFSSGVFFYFIYSVISV